MGLKNELYGPLFSISQLLAKPQARTYSQPDMLLHIHSNPRKSLSIFHLPLLLILVDTTLLHYL